MDEKLKEILTEAFEYSTEGFCPMGLLIKADDPSFGVSFHMEKINTFSPGNYILYAVRVEPEDEEKILAKLKEKEGLKND